MAYPPAAFQRLFPQLRELVVVPGQMSDEAEIRGPLCGSALHILAPFVCLLTLGRPAPLILFVFCLSEVMVCQNLLSSFWRLLFRVFSSI